MKTTYKIILISTLIFVQLLKFNYCSGQVFNWAKQFPLSYSTLNPHIIESDSSLFLAGTVWGELYLDSIEINTPEYWSFISKFDSNRKIKWVKLFEGGTNNLADIVSDNDGNIIVGGYYGNELTIDNQYFHIDDSYADSIGVGTPCFWGKEAYFAKFDNSGQKLWAKLIYGSSDQVIYSVKIDSDNNIILSAMVYSQSPFKVDNKVLIPKYSDPYMGCTFLFKFSPEGNLLWYFDYGKGVPEDLIIDREDNIHLIQYSGEYYTSNLVKLSKDGDIIYDITFANYDVSIFKGVLDQHNNLILKGIRKLPFDEINTALLKLNTRGDSIYWVKEYKGIITNQYLKSDDNNNIYFGGATTFGFMNLDVGHSIRYCNVKLDCTGNIIYIDSPNSNNQGYISDISISDKQLYICGVYYYTNNGSFTVGDTTLHSEFSNIFIVNYTDSSHIVCIDSIQNGISDSNYPIIKNFTSLSSKDNSINNLGIKVYPTIIKESFLVEITSKELLAEEITIEILNVSGFVIFHKNYFMQPSISIDCNSLSSGLYFVKVLKNNNISETYKIIKN
jgi:hypothetical protein